jgi:hypothetical protein
MVDTKTGSLEHTIEELNRFIQLEQPRYIRLLNFLASPFSYESGFYF